MNTKKDHYITQTFIEGIDNDTDETISEKKKLLNNITANSQTYRTENFSNQATSLWPIHTS